MNTFNDILEILSRAILFLYSSFYLSNAKEEKQKHLEAKPKLQPDNLIYY